MSKSIYEFRILKKEESNACSTVDSKYIILLCYDHSDNYKLQAGFMDGHSLLVSKYCDARKLA